MNRQPIPRRAVADRRPSGMLFEDFRGMPAPVLCIWSDLRNPLTLPEAAGRYGYTIEELAALWVAAFRPLLRESEFEGFPRLAADEPEGIHA